MIELKLLNLYFLLMLTMGCLVRHHPMPAQLLLDPACLTAPIMMQRCDLGASPVRCRTIKVEYRKGCERLEVIGHEQPELSSPGQSTR